MNSDPENNRESQLKGQEPNFRRIELDLSVGATVASKYRIISAIGAGGMGAVFKAQQLYSGKMVALKVMHYRLIFDASAVRRFQNEARAASHLSNPHCVNVLDCGVDEDSGQLYLAMDYLSGMALSGFLEEHGPILFENALPIFLQIADGLSHAHKKGVLHRDLKPSNVVLIQNEEQPAVAKLVDFGIAKILLEDGESVQRSMTGTGEIFGSPQYMSPEQCKGLKSIDARSDLYSLGCLMYEVLSGFPPIKGASALDTILKQISEQPLTLKIDSKDPRKDAVTALVMKCLEKEPGDRFQNADELVAALEKIISFKKGLPFRIRTKVSGIKSKQSDLLSWSVLRLLAALLFGIMLFGLSLLPRPDYRDRIVEIPAPIVRRRNTDADSETLNKKYQMVLKAEEGTAGKASSEYLDLCISCGDRFYQLGDLVDAERYYGKAGESVFLMHKSRSEEAAELYLKAARIALVLKSDLQFHRDRMIEVQKILYEGRSKSDTNLGLEVIEAKFLQIEFDRELFKAHPRQSQFLAQIDGSFRNLIDLYYQYFMLEEKTFPSTLIPIFASAGDYFLRQSTLSDDTEGRRNNLDLSEKAYSCAMHEIGAQQEGIELVAISNGMGLVKLWVGETDQAEKHFLLALQRLEQLTYFSDKDKARILLNLADASLKRLKLLDFGRFYLQGIWLWNFGRK